MSDTAAVGWTVTSPEGDVVDSGPVVALEIVIPEDEGVQ